MQQATKTMIPAGPGEMKNLMMTVSASVPTMISKELAEKLARKNYLSRKLKAFWDEILKEDGTAESFIVGEVFQHRNSNCVPQYFSDQFKDWLWVPAKDREIMVDMAPRTLDEYRLPKNMNDTTIQKNAKSTPMNEDEYWLIRYLLIIDPELGKQVLGYELKKDGSLYIMHVKKSDGTVVAVRLRWFGGEWSSGAFRFDGDGDWSGGYLFLSSATAL